MKKSLYLWAFIAAGFVSCEPEFTNPVDEVGFYNSGSADLSTFVTLGNSLTAGYADGSLYLQSQQNSYPNIVAEQFALAGGGEFTQPLVDDNIGGLLFNGSQITNNRLVLRFNAQGRPSPVPLAGTPSTEVTNVLEGPFNNMGVPGAKSFHLLAKGYGNPANFPAAANPYFIRMASNPDASVLEDALAQNPTFFSLWIGNNDALSYATAGASNTDQLGNLNPATYGSGDLTDPTLFAGVYDQLLGALTSNGAKGVVLNLPNVTSIPFFTTVPYNAIPLDAATAAFLNQAYAQYNGGLQLAAANGIISASEAQTRTIQFTAGQNAVVILDETLTDISFLNPGLVKMRQATAQDLLPLTMASVLGTLADPNNPQSVIGVGVPLNDSQVLTKKEIEDITARIASFNSSISQLAVKYDLALVDMNSFLEETSANGYAFEGGFISSTFGTGGAFSLDGVHLTARGYAVVANQIINAVNEKFGANIPSVNPGQYPSVFVE